MPSKTNGGGFFGGNNDNITPAMTMDVGTTARVAAPGGGDSFNKVKDFARSNGVVIIIIIALILIVLAILWIMSIVRQSSFQVVNVSDKVIRLDRAENVPVTYAGSKFPSTNGHEFTFSFWIYLTDYDVLYTHRTLFRRGGTVDSVNLGNPIVGLDAKTNKMYIAIKTNQSLDVRSMEDVLSKNKKYAVAMIDYVPLQRWVHIAFSVQDSILTVFMDGDIYSVKSITDVVDIDPVNTSASAASTSNSASSRAFYSNTMGDLYIGDNKALVKGYLSKLQFFNYACTQKDVQKLYNQGPVQTSIMSVLGLSTYGVRSPVYKIDEME